MTTAAAGESGFPAASALVYRDRHETSLTLLVLGVVITASMVAQIAWPDGNIVGAAWQMGVALTIAFAVSGWPSAAAPPGAPLKAAPGFGLAAIIGIAHIATPVALVLIFAGPFVIFGLGLIMAGLRLGNRSWPAGPWLSGHSASLRASSGLPTGCRTPSGRRGSIPRSTWRWAC